MHFLRPNARAREAAPVLAIASAIALALAPATVWGQTPAAADAVEACARAVDSGAAATYTDLPLGQLKNGIPALRGIKPDDHAPVDSCARILTRTGAMLSDMMPRIPNLIAREELAQTLVSLPFTLDETSKLSTATLQQQQQQAQQQQAMGRRNAPPMAPPPADGGYVKTSRVLEGVELEKMLHGFLIDKGQKATYNFRIRTDDGAGKATKAMVLTELRTTELDQEVPPGAAGTPLGRGFAGAWMMFVPGNVHESRFRYLGQQHIDGHDTYVLAFSQSPDRVAVPGVIRSPTSVSKFFLQGVAWIDVDGFEIVRLHTDLLAPVEAVNLTELRSGIDFKPVKIPEKQLILWLPSNVEILWETKNQAGNEIHEYSRYRLFTATSHVLPQ